MKGAGEMFLLLFLRWLSSGSENNYMAPPGGNSSGVPCALQAPGDMSAARTKTSQSMLSYEHHGHAAVQSIKIARSTNSISLRGFWEGGCTWATRWGGAGWRVQGRGGRRRGLSFIILRAHGFVQGSIFSGDSKLAPHATALSPAEGRLVLRRGCPAGRISKVSHDVFVMWILYSWLHVFHMAEIWNNVAQICWTSDRVHQWSTIFSWSILKTHIIVFDIAGKSYCQSQYSNSLYAVFCCFCC